MSNGWPALRVGDEVLVRGRAVTDRGDRVEVEFYGPNNVYRDWVDARYIADVIPSDQTRTYNGFTVVATRRMICMFDEQIARLDVGDEDSRTEVQRLELASVQGAREDLVRQLEEIHVPVYAPVDGVSSGGAPTSPDSK